MDIQVPVFLLRGIRSIKLVDNSLNAMKSEEHLRKSVTDLFSKVFVFLIFPIDNLILWIFPAYDSGGLF